MVTYTIGKFPGMVNTVMDNDGITVAKAVENAGLAAPNIEVHLNGDRIDDFSMLVPDQGVIAVTEGRIKGN